MAEVTMPQLGETVTEGTVTRWFKQVGDEVALDEALFEVSTDKVDTEVPSPVAGVLSEILANEGDVVEVGQILARVGEPGATPVEPSAAAPQDQASAPPAAVPEPPPSDREQPEPSAPTGGLPAAADPVPAAPAPAHPVPAAADPVPAAPSETPSGAGIVLSPVVRRLIAESGIDASTIVGTGLGGRITRADVEQAIRTRASAPPAREEPVAAPPPPSVAPAESAPAEPAPSGETRRARRRAAKRAAAPAPTAVAGSGDTVVPLNNIRRRTADHMVMSKQTSPHVLTAIEVDYEGVERVRRTAKESWRAQEGFGLTYLPFIARAVIDALRDYPHLNASFGDDELIVHSAVNLAVAVDIDFKGLLAPVVQGAEGKRLRQIARDIVDLAGRARSRKLGLDDLSGGTFTITNAGQYGTMMQFPIINQPQVAILSTDGVSRKPVVVTDAYGNESIAIHSVGVLAMAWDHRAFDGAYAAAFLHRVKELIETRDWETEIR